jgi:hypothetical protein
MQKKLLKRFFIYFIYQFIFFSYVFLVLFKALNLNFFSDLKFFWKNFFIFSLIIFFNSILGFLLVPIEIYNMLEI